MVSLSTIIDFCCAINAAENVSGSEMSFEYKSKAVPGETSASVCYNNIFHSFVDLDFDKHTKKRQRLRFQVHTSVCRSNYTFAQSMFQNDDNWVFVIYRLHLRNFFVLWLRFLCLLSRISEPFRCWKGLRNDENNFRSAINMSLAGEFFGWNLSIAFVAVKEKPLISVHETEIFLGSAHKCGPLKRSRMSIADECKKKKDFWLSISHIIHVPTFLSARRF